MGLTGLLTLSASLWACGEARPHQGPDAAPSMDAGPSDSTIGPQPDAGTVDAGPETADAGRFTPDVGEPAQDAGEPEDAGGDPWGRETAALPEYYPAADVPQSQIDLIAQDYGTAGAAWGNFGPLEFWIVGRDEAAAQALDVRYCQVRLEKDPGLGPDFQRHCRQRDYSFVDYVRDGGAGLNTMRNEHSDYSAFIVTFASKFPGPDETDYTVVTFHEYFHVYQHAHIFSRNEAERERRILRNPWWAEGSAEYMAQRLYARQPGVHPGYLRDVMTRKLESARDLREGESIADIPYGERAHIAYDLGTWFVAYLVNRVGEDTFRVAFHDDLNALGFEGAFEAHFGVPSTEMLTAFDQFLQLPLAEQLEILPR